jgi:cytochrome b
MIFATLSGPESLRWSSNNGKESVKVWDVFVRIFHWALVGDIIGMFITGEDFKNVHVNLG